MFIKLQMLQLIDNVISNEQTLYEKGSDQSIFAIRDSTGLFSAAGHSDIQILNEIITKQNPQQFLEKILQQEEEQG